tara:strand:- start:1158 stop:1919 length:762 start_codon:yes stop_codon:yes gene_type:complete
MNVVDLNADVGESYGLMHSGIDSEIIPHVTSVNIATGFHSGDPDTIRKTINLALSNSKSIGAHPSYPDLQGFGRRKIDMDIDSIENLISYQIGALYAYAKDELKHVKPHGALYNNAAKDLKIAEAIFKSVDSFDSNLIHVSLSNSEWSNFLKSKKVKVANEGFADRAYDENGHLVSRSIEGSVLHNEDEIIERVIGMVKNKTVKSITGKVIKLNVDTICLHGDNKESVSLAKKLKNELLNSGCEIKSLPQFVN